MTPHRAQAAYDEVIAIGATGYDNSINYYSNAGEGQELVAPGGDCTVDLNADGEVDGVMQESFDWRWENAYAESDKAGEEDWSEWVYRSGCGTSFSAPHVAGAAALLISEGVDDPEVIRQILRESALDLGAAGYDGTYGYGLLDVRAALDLIGQPLPPCEIAVAPEAVDFGTVDFGDTRTLPLKILSNRSGICMVSALTIDGDTDFLLNSTGPEPPFIVIGEETVSLDYAPSGEGEDEAKLEIVSNDPLADRIELSLTGSGSLTDGVDLSIEGTALQEPVYILEEFAYSITVTNQGRSTATGVRMTDQFPEEIELSSVTPERGTCRMEDGVVCDIGALESMESTRVEIAVLAVAPEGATRRPLP